MSGFNRVEQKGELIVAQRVDWLQPRSFVGRENAEHDSDKSREGKRQNDRIKRNRSVRPIHHPNDIGAQITEPNAERAAHCR